MTESNLWGWLRRARDEAGPALHMSRMENLVEAGRPDVEGCYLGEGFHLELKVAKRPVRSSTLLSFGSPVKENQCEWAKARLAAGGATGFLIRVGSGSEGRVYLIHGARCRDLQERVGEMWLEAHNLLDKQSPLCVIRAAVLMKSAVL